MHKPSLFIRRTSLFAGLIYLLTTLGAMAGLFDPWAWKMSVGFDGYTHAETLTNFPVLIQLEEGSNLFSYTYLISPDDGADLRFSSADGLTELPYEIELWNTSGVSYVWVKTTLTGATDSVWAYFGKTGQSAPAYTTNGAVWTEGFKAVWHMGNDGSTRPDSTANSYTGTVDATGVTATDAGFIGKADLFTGTTSGAANNPPTSGGINCGNVSVTGSQTIEMWLSAANLSERRNPVNKAYCGEGTMTIEKTGSIGYYYGLAGSDAAGYQGHGTPGGIVTASPWIHIAHVRDLTADPKMLRWYANGRQVSSVAASFAVATASANALRIGKGYVYCFNGLLDEVRVSEAARSSNWVWAGWMNTASNRNFLSYSDLTTSGGRPFIYNESPTNISSTTAFLNSYLSSTGTSATTVWLFWGDSDGGDPTSGLWQATNQWAEGAWGEGSHPTFEATGLDADQTYYYRYFATNDGGASWAPTTKSFINGNVTIAGITNASESGLAEGTFSVYRPATATNEDLVVHFSVDETVVDTATDGVDYTLDAYSVTIPKGQTSAVIVIHTLEDYIEPEEEETVKLDLLAGNYIVGNPSNATIVITNALPSAPVNVWLNTIGDNSAATAGNWSLNEIPTSAHDILLTGYTSDNITWNSPATNQVNSWIQTDLYTGTVTIATMYPSQGGFTNLTIHSDCVISNGTWTHLVNSDTEVYRLAVSVGTNFVLGTNGLVDLNYKGYAAKKGPGAGNGISRTGSGGSPTVRPGMSASHGGRGGYNPLLTNSAPTYGSVIAPTHLGSGSQSYGGGAMELRVRGKTTIEGTVSANGMPHSEVAVAAGGSLYLVTGELEGSGMMRANGGGGCWDGGGGRIAVIVTNSESFGSVIMQTFSGQNQTTRSGSAGTIYRETKSQGPGKGTVVINNNNKISSLMTPLPREYDPYPAPQTTSEVAFAFMILTNRGHIVMTDYLVMQDISQINANTILDLNNYTLFLRADEHALGAGSVASNGGEIVWSYVAPTFRLDIQQGPNGTATTNKTGRYNEGTVVTDILASPNPGYDFIRWHGDVPSSNMTDNPLSLTMNQSRSIRALFGSSHATTKTWLGIHDVYATNAANWHPASIPTTGDSVVLDGTSMNNPYFGSWSVNNMTWDLDAALASWTQKIDYTGTVTIKTRYPGYGSFTNFVISGDCIISNGTWIHPVNSGTNNATDRLCMSVRGRFILGIGSAIDLSARGYYAGGQYVTPLGPGRGNVVSASTPTSGRAASHGGRGAYGSATNAASCYGSILAPETLGSSAYSRGGGAIRLDITGPAEIHGMINVSGGSGGASYPGAAGGSVFLRAPVLSGSGQLQANGGAGYQSGGGGRIAVVLTNANSFGNVTMSASGGSSSQNGAAGTIYLQGAQQAPNRGTLLVDNNNYAVSTNAWHTELPPVLTPDAEALMYTSLILTNTARVHLTAELWMGDLFIRTNSPTRLDLNGFDLNLKAENHEDDWTPDNVIQNGGEIIWSVRGAVIVIL